MEKKIKGLKINYKEDNLKIIDSYQITNIDKMKIILEEALNKTIIYITDRSIDSLINE